jgi:hypothetical protein
MRTLAALSLLLVLSTASAGAQGAVKADDPIARTLLRLEDQWASALVRRDGATFQRLLARGFVYTENDAVQTRDEVIRGVSAGTDTVTEAHNEGMQVHRWGGATAVVTGWLIVRGRGPSGPFDRRYRFTDTWAHRNGLWQIVAAHDYLVPRGS